tara:strand:+ start:75 stop:371 length:297 start_codon:yes stop_codon:yes gene_type:complete
MKTKIIIKDSQFDNLINKLEEMPISVMKTVYPYYVNSTPIRSGNARNRTKLNKTTISSKYAYAGRLDEGWSKQAPKGFTDPSIDQLEKLINNYVKRVS